MLSWKSKLIVGGGFNPSVGNAQKRGVINVAGVYGLATMNTAGVNLINCCNETYLCWASSFFRHSKPGTWRHPRTRKRYEIDGFRVRQEDRCRWIKKVTTIRQHNRLSQQGSKFVLANLSLSIKREQISKKPNRTIIDSKFLRLP